MFRLLTLLAPFLVRASSGSRERNIVRALIASVLILVSVIFGTTALYVWSSSVYGTATACLILGAFFLVIGVITLNLPQRRSTVHSSVPATLESDPLAQHIPDAIKDDPAMKAILEKIADNPVAATSAAVAIGMILSRELIGKE